MEKFSLMVAAYNIEPYISQCMDSCVNQTDKDVEIIVVDDGSTDGTDEILETYRKYPFVKIIRHDPNKGLSEVRKTGYANATGSFLLFVDGDDWLETDAVALLRQFLEENACDILCFLFAVEHGRKSMDYPLEPFDLTKGDEFLIRLFTGRIPPSIFTKLIRREYIEKNNVAFPPPLNCGEDVALAASLGMHKPQAALLSRPLYHYRVRPSSLSASPSSCMLDILPATLFVKEKLRQYGLFSTYKDEFEYYAFLHNLFYRFDAMFLLPNPYNNALYDNWRSLEIDLSSNVYFHKNFSEDTPKNLFMKELGTKA